MNTTAITPTVGRVVWFYPANNQATPGFTPPAPGEPLAAIIAGVVDANIGAVNLTVFDGIGVPRPEPYVLLFQDGETPPATGRYATWMPYQIGQAKKHAVDQHIGAALQQTNDAALSASRDFDAESRRAHALQAALQTSHPSGRDAADVLAAAKVYEDYLRGHCDGRDDDGTHLSSVGD